MPHSKVAIIYDWTAVIKYIQEQDKYIQEQQYSEVHPNTYFLSDR